MRKYYNETIILSNRMIVFYYNREERRPQMSNKRNAFYFSLLTFILLMLAQIAFPFQTHAEPLNEIETEVETEDLDTYQEHPSEVTKQK